MDWLISISLALGASVGVFYCLLCIAEQFKQAKWVQSRAFFPTLFTVSFVIAPIILSILFHSIGASGFFSGSDNGTKGDGITTCRNCGRHTDLVSEYGYCETCYDGYLDWREDYWKEEYD